MSSIASVAITAIQFSQRNPRADAGEDLQGLSVSMGNGDKSRQAQPPSVVALPDGAYRLIDGERRLRALQERSDERVEVVVMAVEDPLEEHTLRLLANTHHRPLHPLERAVGLMISFLCANADARELRTPARAILDCSTSANCAITELQQLLADNGWNPRRPDVKWQELLDNLGIEMDPSRRKQLIRLLGLQPQLVSRVRALNLRDPSLRALATMQPEDQEHLVAELEKDLSLETHTRHIARMLKMGIYRSLDDALATIRGEVVDFPLIAPDEVDINEGATTELLFSQPLIAAAAGFGADGSFGGSSLIGVAGSGNQYEKSSHAGSSGFVGVDGVELEGGFSYMGYDTQANLPFADYPDDKQEWFEEEE